MARVESQAQNVPQLLSLGYKKVILPHISYLHELFTYTCTFSKDFRFIALILLWIRPIPG